MPDKLTAHMNTSSHQLIEVGPVIGLAVRPGKDEPMVVVEQVSATAAQGVVEDYGQSLKRGITFISSMQWQQVQDELFAELPWQLRRANVLVEAHSLEHLIGTTVQVGSVWVEVAKETEPCGLMEELHAGLEAALVPDCRGGVYGKVVGDGVIRVGDSVVIRKSI